MIVSCKKDNIKYFVTCDCQNLSYGNQLCGHKYNSIEDVNDRLKRARFHYDDSHKYRSPAPFYNVNAISNGRGDNNVDDMQLNVIYQTIYRDNYDCCQLFVVKTDKDTDTHAYGDENGNEYLIDLSPDIIFERKEE